MNYLHGKMVEFNVLGMGQVAVLSVQNSGNSRPEEGNLCVPITSWQPSKSLSDSFAWLLPDEELA